MTTDKPVSPYIREALARWKPLAEYLAERGMTLADLDRKEEDQPCSDASPKA